MSAFGGKADMAFRGANVRNKQPNSNEVLLEAGL